MNYTHKQCVLMGQPILLIILMSVTNFNLAASLCTIETDQTRIEIQVFNDTERSNKGHNHVISSQTVIGQIQYNHQNIIESNYQITIPTQSLVVNDPRVRQRSGALFESKPNALINLITRNKMLGRNGIHSQNFPNITLTSHQLFYHAEQLMSAFDLSLHGVKQRITIPLQMQTETADEHYQIVISGFFSILQSQFGIQPITVFFGALGVKDELNIEFLIAANCSKD